MLRILLYVLLPYIKIEYQTRKIQQPLQMSRRAIELKEESRSARIDLRLTPSEKQLIATAAAYEEMDLSAFTRRTILVQARTIVEQAERIRLSETDFARVMDLLESPPEPTPALLEAIASKYGER